MCVCVCVIEVAVFFSSFFFVYFFSCVLVQHRLYSLKAPEVEIKNGTKENGWKWRSNKWSFPLLKYIYVYYNENTLQGVLNLISHYSMDIPLNCCNLAEFETLANDIFRPEAISRIWVSCIFATPKTAWKTFFCRRVLEMQSAPIRIVRE